MGFQGGVKVMRRRLQDAQELQAAKARLTQRPADKVEAERKSSGKYQHDQYKQGERFQGGVKVMRRRLQDAQELQAAKARLTQRPADMVEAERKSSGKYQHDQYKQGERFQGGVKVTRRRLQDAQELQ